MSYAVEMAAREEVLKKIARKRQDISELELQIRDARAFIQGMEEVLKLLPRDPASQNAEQILRPGTAIFNARKAIQTAGKPLHITDILKALGMDVTKKNRLSLSGSLSGYARRSEVFNRPAPNTFGLVEFGPINELPVITEPPEDFGDDQAGLQEDGPESLDLEILPITEEDVPF